MITAAKPVNPSIDAAQFAADAERITNNQLLDEWLALYHPDATAEWIADGAYERHQGIASIKVAATAMAKLWKEQQLRVKKTVEAADSNNIVMSWHGGFRKAPRQFGVEIWTLRDNKVIRHQMYLYLDLRPSTSLIAKLRVFLASPSMTLAILKHQRNAKEIVR